ncbi:MAG: hypothetical protein AAFQ94_21010 [Bacteroidota bacterium]
MNEKYNRILPSLELILDYLDGILDAQASSELEKAIEGSDELKSIIEGISLYYESEGRDRDKLEAYVEQVRINQQLKTHHSSFSQSEAKSKSLLFNFRIAATIAFFLLAGLFAIYFIIPQNNVGDMISAHLKTPYEAPEVFRNSAGSSDVIWSDFIAAYQNKDFEKAIAILEELPDSASSQMNARFYKGLCNLYKRPSNLTKTINHLTVVSASDHRLNEQATWFLALTYYKKREWSKAMEVFEKISRSNLYKKKEAKQIIELLSD